ncbi:hypothetical protein [Rhizobium laguerreae]|uniref:hypothetical protein n=1 Tax=Rhizobium laguerreae TaxID=1076926 RepID=UPI001C90F7D9|nr:hypothetical protein [Rhizobium laguerreae]MBY3118260.1 hypothetical protein [Rhizobium laguerreae]MBY3135619.1 hypothetical protein [Rhizobium laguerreae]MBY3158194.1 hypothetical protein [Rhizobium laguerreae]MBY3170132.1 hypothetical protein [Rhizobium laguerreae]MBY3190967.1 hypothetical protein [Rhizobium laguerreae]
MQVQLECNATSESDESKKWLHTRKAQPKLRLMKSRGAAQVPISLLQANAMPGLAMMAVTSASPIVENEKRFIDILLSSPRQLCRFGRLSQNDECLMASGGVPLPDG